MTDTKKTPPTGKTPKTQNPPEKAPERPREIGGREGPDPVRYGDWENNGIASDF